MLRDKVFHIGLRYGHHARHSGYESFIKYVGTQLIPPVQFRWTHGKMGWSFNRFVAKVTRHPWYSPGAHAIEWGAFRHMLRHRNCLYHVLYGDSDLWLLRRANQISGNRLIASFHQPTSQLKQLGSIKRIARHLDGVIIVCKAQRTYFETFLDPNQIFVVPHSVHSEFFRPPSEPARDPVCMTVGAHLRDFDTFGKTIRFVWQERPDVRFTAVGTRSDKRFFFSGLDDPRIRYLDRVSDDDMLKELRAAQLAIFSFQDVTANNATLEAMSSGLPIVATDVGGIRDYVNEDTGILYPKGDPKAAAQAVLRLLEDSEARERMGAAARRRAIELDHRRIANKMIKIYQQLLKKDS